MKLLVNDRLKVDCYWGSWDAFYSRISITDYGCGGIGGASVWGGKALGGRFLNGTILILSFSCSG